MREVKETLQAAIDALGLTIVARFVPWSKSRNSKEKHRSLNWSVTLQHKGRDVMTTDYSAGIAQCHAYKASIKELGGRDCIMRHDAINKECESGKAYVNSWKDGTALLPDTCAVIYSLVLDSEAIDYPTFEDWAGNFGYDVDSRAGEAIYRQCLEIGLKLRAAIGDTGLATLREASQDY